MAFFPDVDDIAINGDRGIGIDFIFKDGQHLMNERGILYECGDRENIQNWIRKAVTTQKNVYKVYTEAEAEVFGVSIYDEIGKKNRGYRLSELKREITEQLLKSSYIDDVKDFEISSEKRRVDIDFTVVCSDGIQLRYSEMSYDDYSYGRVPEEEPEPIAPPAPSDSGGLIGSAVLLGEGYTDEGIIGIYAEVA